MQASEEPIQDLYLHLNVTPCNCIRYIAGTLTQSTTGITKRAICTSSYCLGCHGSKSTPLLCKLWLLTSFSQTLNTLAYSYLMHTKDANGMYLGTFSQDLATRMLFTHCHIKQIVLLNSMQLVFMKKKNVVPLKSMILKFHCDGHQLCSSENLLRVNWHRWCPPAEQKVDGPLYNDILYRITDTIYQLTLGTRSVIHLLSMTQFWYFTTGYKRVYDLTKTRRFSKTLQCTNVTSNATL